MFRRLSAAFIVAMTLVLFIPVLAPATSSVAEAHHDVGPTRVYFPETGHHLSSGFLDYWRHNGGLYQFGYPLTEEMNEGGLTVQYFERAVFEWHPNAPAGWRVQLRRLGADMTAHRTGEAPFQRVTGQSNANTIYFPETGHRLSFGFKTYWERNGGLRINGYPISEEFQEGGFTVQYFERVRYEWHPEHRGTKYEILLGHLGRQAAKNSGVNIDAVARGNGVKDYHPNLWYVPAPPKPATPVNVAKPPAGAPKTSGKWIEVDLTKQYLRAWQGTTLVYGTSVSTGKASTPTPTGTFSIYQKVRSETMTGGTRGIDYYYLTNVPHTMYFLGGGYAIHGAYWHTNWGTPMSRGCVNLPLGAAEWLYNWAPMGTTVWIHR
jgi:lipoprotein-anchoring transpeptidase ErfK/SrfK